MNRWFFALACVCAALVPCGSAAAGLIVGINDDVKYEAAASTFFMPTMQSEGLRMNALTIRWDETYPAGIQPDLQDYLTQAIGDAAAAGVTVELDLYPLHSQVFTGGARCAPSTNPVGCGDTGKLNQWATWVAMIARMFPTVHQFIVMNECNQPLFVNPQFDSAGKNQSAAVCGRALAAAYDALKAASPANFVWGVGLSPRGNDNPNASSNVSTSPTAFLRALGTWFKAFVQATGRTRPLMDGLDFHPYPIPQSLPFAQGYAGLTSATVSNLPRIYQAFYDGFSGSFQPTIGQQLGGGLPVSLNEVGIQTDSTAKPGYVGAETAADAAGGVIGTTATEAYQSSWYLQMLALVACDPSVQRVNIYHLIDEPALSGWQSGLFYIDRTAKLSATTVHDWIASTAGNCQGPLHPWTPPGLAVAGVPAPALPASGERIATGSAGRVRIFDAVTHFLRRQVAPFGTSYTGPVSLGVGDANGDGVRDFAVGTGPGRRAAVKVLNGKTGVALASYAPFPASFTGGVSVALGDVNGDRRADLLVGTGPGVPAQVKVYDGRTHRLLETLSPFGPAYTGGVAVAAGDLDGDRHADVIAGTGPGTKARIAVFSGATGALLESFAPFSPTFAKGVVLATGDVNGDGKADVVVGTAGGPSVVRVYAGATKTRLLSFSAFSPQLTGGVTVAATDVNGDKSAEVVVGSGTGGNSQVRLFDGKTGALLLSFLGAPGSAALSVAAG
jgi:hypothetical protein